MTGTPGPQRCSPRAANRRLSVTPTASKDGDSSEDTDVCSLGQEEQLEQELVSLMSEIQAWDKVDGAKGAHRGTLIDLGPPGKRWRRIELVTFGPRRARGKATDRTL